MQFQNKHFTREFVFVLGMLLTLGACSYGTYFVPKQQRVYAPTNPENIAISAQHDLSVPFERLGRVAVTVWGSGEGARDRLQEEASRMGANAILEMRLDRSFGRTAASGVAVRVLGKQ